MSFNSPWYSGASEMQKPITRREISDVWYAAARLQEQAGDKEAAKMSRRSARWFRGKWR